MATTRETVPENYLRRAAIGATCMGLAVVAGAIGAHALQRVVSESQLEIFKTAVLYQLIHSLALTLLPLVARSLSLSAVSIARAWNLLALGVVVFSGSLYCYVLSGIKFFAMITPIGGTLFIVAWGYLAVMLWRASREPVAQ